MPSMPSPGAGARAAKAATLASPPPTSTHTPAPLSAGPGATPQHFCGNWIHSFIWGPQTPKRICTFLSILRLFCSKKAVTGAIIAAYATPMIPSIPKNCFKKDFDTFSKRRNVSNNP